MFPHLLSGIQRSLSNSSWKTALIGFLYLHHRYSRSEIAGAANMTITAVSKRLETYRWAVKNENPMSSQHLIARCSTTLYLLESHPDKSRIPVFEEAARHLGVPPSKIVLLYESVYPIPLVPHESAVRSLIHLYSQNDPS